MYRFCRFYTKEHEWIDLKNNYAEVGITKYASEQLGEVALFDPKELGTEVELNESLGALECVKVVAEIYSPLKGTITEIN